MIDLTIKTQEKRVEVEVLIVTGEEMAQEKERENRVLRPQVNPVVHHLQIIIRREILNRDNKKDKASGIDEFKS